MALTVINTNSTQTRKDERIAVLDTNSAREAMNAYHNCIMIDDNGNVIDRKKTAFKFSELDDKAKDRARDWFSSGIELWTDNYTDFLTMCGFDKPQLSYSISYSQGDFAAFDSHFFSYEKGFVKTVERNFGTGSYWHKAAIDLRVIYAKSFYQMTGKTFTRGCTYQATLSDIRQYEFSQFEDVLNEWLYAVCEEIRVQLYKDYEYQCSDEGIGENSEANEYRFDEHGRII